MGWVACLVNAVAWGGELVLMKLFMEHASAPVAAFHMYAVCSVFLLLHVLVRKRLTRKYLRVGWSRLLLIGFLGSFINLFMFIGVKLSDPTSAAIVQRIQILFAILLGWLALRERPRWGDLPALVGMAAGFIVLQMPLEKLHLATVGNFLVLASAFLIALNALLIKALARAVPVELIALANSCIISLSMVAIAGCAGHDLGVAVRGDGGYLLLWIGLGMGFLASASFVAYYYALKKLAIWQVSMTFLMIPVVSGVLQWTFLDAPVTGRQVLGMVLVSAGAVVLILLHQMRLRRSSAAV